MTLDYIYCKKHFKSWHTEEDKKIADEYLKHNKGWTSDFNTDQCSECNEPAYVIVRWKDLGHTDHEDDYKIVDAIKFKKDKWEIKRRLRTKNE